MWVYLLDLDLFFNSYLEPKQGQKQELLLWVMPELELELDWDFP